MSGYAEPNVAAVAERVLSLPRECWDRDDGWEALSTADQGLVQLADLIASGETLIAVIALVDDGCACGLCAQLAISNLPRLDLAQIALAAAASAQYVESGATGAEPGELARAYSVFLAVAESGAEEER
jgi:hypothetical protein